METNIRYTETLDEIQKYCAIILPMTESEKGLGVIPFSDLPHEVRDLIDRARRTGHFFEGQVDENGEVRVVDRGYAGCMKQSSESGDSS